MVVLAWAANAFSALPPAVTAALEIPCRLPATFSKEEEKTLRDLSSRLIDLSKVCPKVVTI